MYGKDAYSFLFVNLQKLIVLIVGKKIYALIKSVNLIFNFYILFETIKYG